MVSEDDASQVAENLAIRDAFPLLFGIGADERGEHYPPVAPVDVVSVGHCGHPGGTVVIDKDGVYLVFNGRCRELYRWTDPPESRTVLITDTRPDRG